MVGSDRIASTFALPHENKGQRLPTIPAVMTATVDLMSDATRSVTTSKRFALCRDVCYPLWSDRTVESCGGYSCLNIELTAVAGAQIPIPPWTTKFSTSRIVDGVTLSAQEFEDTCIISGANDPQIIYIPQGSFFQFRFDEGGVPTAGSYLEVELRSYVAGDWVYCRATTAILGNAQILIGAAGGAPAAGSGTVMNGGVLPVGFTELVSIRTAATAPAAAVFPCTMYLGFSSSVVAVPGAPAAAATLFVPAFRPPEFRNSTLPYRKTRLNASAVLFSNVTPVLQKEGTVLAGRLQTSTIDMFNFTAASIDASHPSQRYFGALENGLYTFTAPSTNVDQLIDRVTNMLTTECPTFDFLTDNLYNAMIFTDLDAVSISTLAISLYVHLEFACTSSLFAIGVSPLTIEVLHQAEVKLLKAGYYHENPNHVSSVQKSLGRQSAPQRVMSQVRMSKPQQARPKPAKKNGKKTSKKVKAQNRRR